MDIRLIFLERYDPLYRFYLAGFWSHVPHDLMRVRPHSRANSIAWNIWHLTRCEDAGLDRFVFDRPQVLDEGLWMQRMDVPWRHHGTGMTFSEVDELSGRINLTALKDYSQSVQARTRSLIDALDTQNLDAKMEEKRLRKIMVDEGLAHSQAEGFIENYLGWTKSKCLMSFGLTHSFLHLGEMEVLASLLGVEFD